MAGRVNSLVESVEEHLLEFRFGKVSKLIHTFLVRLSVVSVMTLDFLQIRQENQSSEGFLFMSEGEAEVILPI